MNIILRKITFLSFTAGIISACTNVETTANPRVKSIEDTSEIESKPEVTPDTQDQATETPAYAEMKPELTPPVDPESELPTPGAVVSESTLAQVADSDVEKLPTPEEDVVDFHAALDELPQGDEQMAILCKRNKNDGVRAVFCKDDAPKITSLVELQESIGLNIETSRNANFTLVGHSSSLVARFTSVINPRAIFFAEGNRGQGFMTMGYVRGEQFVEIISEDPDTGDFNFFLGVFKQACNSKPEGCSYGDLLTPSVEKDWTSLTFYEDDDLDNTILDCKQCHQPQGPGTPKVLRMQELEDPWTHFFISNRPDGEALIKQYQAAKGDEVFAGIPGDRIEDSDPQGLERFVKRNSERDPSTEFDSEQIRDEFEGSGSSQTWQALYAKHEAGEIIAPPYFGLEINDTSKLADMTQAYRSFREGGMKKEALPDIRLTHDRKKLSDIGFAVTPGQADGVAIIKQACGQCHNPAQNQLEVSKSRFNALDLAANPEAVKQVAVHRLVRSYRQKDDLKAMPPVIFKELTDEEIGHAIRALGGNPDELLDPAHKKTSKALY